jgi:hypothetical protein
MSLPKWNDSELKLGTMARTALWLISEVGVGNTFTKEMHRRAFAGIAQADRRLRDLRKFGWIISTSHQDVTLRANEQRLVAVGLRVWESRASQDRKDRPPSAKERMSVLAEHNFQCAVCGIGGGEEYPDNPGVAAVLSVSRRWLQFPNGTSKQKLVPECKICRAGAGNHPISVASALDLAASLCDADKTTLAEWAKRGRRGALEKAWSAYRRLPQNAKDHFWAELASRAREPGSS